MKYFFRILLVLIVAAAVVFAVFCYTNGNPLQKNNSVQLTTVSKPAATEKNSNRILLASLNGEDYKLYKAGKTVILVHGGKEFEFENWSNMIDAEEPELHLADFDSDGNNELLVKAVSTQLQDGSFVYELYVLKPVKDSEGKDSFEVIRATKSTWSEILDTRIRKEISQLKSCKKILQIAMSTMDRSISYDNKTGIAKDSEYSEYFRAAQDENGNYLTLEKWERGEGIYSINSKNKICVETDITVRYKDSSVVQKAGKLYFELEISKKTKEYFVTEKTMVFKPDEKYRVSDPSVTSAGSWSYVEHNSDKSSPEDKRIDWIKYSPKFSKDVFEQTQRFSGSDTDLNRLSKIEITNGYLELTAKKGFSFDSSLQKKGEYSVTINRGKDNEYEISYTSSLMEKNGAEVLRINFDKSYPRDEIDTVDISFGSK